MKLFRYFLRQIIKSEKYTFGKLQEQAITCFQCFATLIFHTLKNMQVHGNCVFTLFLIAFRRYFQGCL